MTDSEANFLNHNQSCPFPVAAGTPHMWTALHGKHYFGASNDLVGCGHMSGLSMRSICPLALMESD
ncbi:MAG: hypothetical protein ACLP4V_13045, partial [Methylocella sp.]